jgi:hypothetical protein
MDPDYLAGDDPESRKAGAEPAAEEALDEVV